MRATIFNIIIASI